jgi:hypothetical protein
MKKNFRLIVISVFFVTQTFAAETAPQQDLVKNQARQSGNAQRTGQMVATAAIAITSVGAVATCWKPSPKCKYWVAGLVASGVALGVMSMAGNKSKNTYDAVSVNGQGNALSGEVDVNNQKAVAAAQKKFDTVKKDLTKKGYKFDVAGKNGKPDPMLFQTPDGKVHNAQALMNGPAGGSNASSSEFGAFKEFKNEMNQKMAQAADKLPSSGESEFAEGGGGGKSAAPGSGFADGSDKTETGGDLENSGATEQLALETPAVEGLSRNVASEKIGVAGDSLFSMVDRRYELHEKKGSFLQLSQPSP